MSADAPPSMTAGLLHRTLRRRWPLLLGWAALVSLVGFAYVGGATPSYTSSAEVLVRPLEGNAFSPSVLSSSQQVTVGLTTEANLVGSPEVVLSASRAAGSPVEPGQHAHGTVVLNSQLIRVSYSARSTDQARAGAEAVAQAFLDFRRRAAETVRTAEVRQLQQDVTSTSQALAKVAGTLGSAHAPAGAAARAQVLTTRLSGLQQSLGSAESESTEPGSVVVPADSPGHLQALRPVLLAVVGGLFALLAALLAACWRTWVYDPLTPADREVAGLPVWATLPSARGWTSARRTRRGKRLAERYRQLRTVLAAELPAPCVVTLAGVDDGTELAKVAANLAACLRVGGFGTILVDCDARYGTLGRLLGLEQEAGLCELLLGGDHVAGAPQAGDGVRVIPLGTAPDEAADLLAGRAFDDLIAELLRQTSYVVLVVPELDSAIGLRCAGLSDAVLLVAADGRTRRRDAEDVVARAVARAAFTSGTTRAAVVARLPRRRRFAVPRRPAGPDKAPTTSPAVVEQLRQEGPGAQEAPGEGRDQEDEQERRGRRDVEVGESA